MTTLSDRLTPKKERDLKVLRDFVQIYCREKHREEAKTDFRIRDERLRQILSENSLSLCPDCDKLLTHGMSKLLQCTQDPKPMCKKCEIHCYAPGYREKIREVMKFSGLYLVKHGRIDLLTHYFL
ncbi:MAG: nitrous oxide-stimulated promoter family protein [Chloroflexi bacterium]|nr:nitrous oxide-stimulated promoter family protein [Chloroflexota bacterium]